MERNLTTEGTGLDNGPASLLSLVFFAVQGSVGNILIISAVAIDTQLRSYTDAFIVNVAVMDLLITSVGIPSMIPLLLAAKNVYSHTLCQVQVFGVMTVMLCISSLASLTMVAVNRYVLICARHLYGRVYTRTNMAFMMTGCWLYGLIVSLPTVLGWGGVNYRAPASMCCYDHTVSLSHLIFLFITAINVPMAVTFGCYGKIAFDLWKSKQRVAAHGSNQKKQPQVWTMFAVSAMFTFFWFPYCTIAILEHLMTITPIFIRIAGWLGMINSCANSIVLGIFNTKYRAAYKKILCFWKRKKVTRIESLRMEATLA